MVHAGVGLARRSLSSPASRVRMSLALISYVRYCYGIDRRSPREPASRSYSLWGDGDMAFILYHTWRRERTISHSKYTLRRSPTQRRYCDVARKCEDIRPIIGWNVFFPPLDSQFRSKWQWCFDAFCAHAHKVQNKGWWSPLRKSGVLNQLGL